MLLTYVTNLLNKILVATGGVGLILQLVTGTPATTPALQVLNSSKQDVVNVDFQGNVSGSGSAKFRGSLSGSSLFGAALVDCDVSTNKLLYDLSTGKFSCSTDLNTGTTVNTGALLTAADGRFVNQGGDTMTGALKVRANLSGSTLNVDNLRSCNTIDTDPAGRATCGTDADTSQSLFETIAVSGQSNVVADGPTDTLTLAAGSNVTLTTNAGTDTVTIAATDTNTTYTAGQLLTPNGTTFRVNDALTGTSLRIRGTASGSIVHADSQLRSSGSLAVRGTVAFRGLASCTNLQTSSSGALACNTTTYQTTTLAEDNAWVGNGTAQATALPSCSTASTSKLLYNTATNAFTCGTDTDTNTTYTAGQNLTLTSTAFSLNSTISGAVVRFTTLSGSTVYAKSRLASSGSLKVLGNMSAASLNVNNLISCPNLQTSSAGALSCNNTAYLTADQQTAGQGLTLTSGSFKVNATLTGTTIKFGTVSGNTLVVSSLKSCSIIVTDANGNTSCGTAYTQATADNRFVNTSGDTMTGNLLVRATASGSILHADSQLRSSGTLVVRGTAKFYSTTNVIGSATFDTNTLFVDAAGHKVGVLTTAPKTALEVAGTMSGRSLTISGLRNCDTVDIDANGNALCGTDASGGGGSTDTGALLLAADGRFVNQGGDTMTGALTINLSSGTLGLVVKQTLSGSRIVASSGINSSGAVVIRKTAGTSTGNILIVDTKGLVYDASNRRVGIGTASPAEALHLSGSMILENGKIIKFKNTAGTARSVIQYLSDDRLYLQSQDNGIIFRTGASAQFSNIIDSSGRWGLGHTSPSARLSVSGSAVISALGNVIANRAAKAPLEVIGTASASLLTVTGLKSCDTIDTDANGVFSCGTDASGGGGSTNTERCYSPQTAGL